MAYLYYKNITRYEKVTKRFKKVRLPVLVRNSCAPILSEVFFPYFYQLPVIVINRNKYNEKKIKIWALKG